MTKVLNDLGLSSGSISSWRNGGWPNSSVVISMAKYFNISTDEILFGAPKNKDDRIKYVCNYLNTMDDSDFDLLISIAKEIVNHKNN